MTAKRGQGVDPLHAIWQGLRKEFLWILAVSLVINIAMTSPMLYMLQIYDRVVISQNEFTLLGLTAVLLVALVFMTFAERARSALLIRVGERLDVGLSDWLMQHAYAGMLAGRRANQPQQVNDLRMLQQALSGPGMFALFDSPWLPIYLGILYLLHPMLGVIALGFALAQVLATWLLQRVTDHAAIEAESHDIKANELLFRRLRHVETVEAMGMLGSIRADWHELTRAQRQSQERFEKLAHRLGLIATLMKQAQPSLILGAGALLAIRGDISLGAMAAAQMLMAKTLQPIDQLIAAWPQLGQAKIAYDRIKLQVREGLERGLSSWDASASPASEATASPGAVAAQAKLELDRVSVKPPGTAPVLFENFSLVLQPGRSYALLGPSGIGKSSLAKMIVGVWQAPKGEVRWAGHAVSDWDRLGLRSSIGYLPQDVVLMEGSIAENIGRLQSDDAEGITEAAQMAGVHEMILRMPRGYDTAVGEAGSYLSAGQRQRIGLARALYGNPKLLVLDEPNASLDPAGEEALGAALLAAKAKGAIVLVITHRSAVLGFCDEVIDLTTWRKQGEEAQ